MSSLEFGWTWHLLTAERESHSSARFASSKLPHGVSSASASGDWRAGPKCRKKVTANQVTLWPQWAGLVCWLVVTKCPLHGSTEFWVFICVDAPIQPNESWDVEFPVLLSQSNRESWVVVFPTLMFLSNWVTFLFCFFSFFCLWSLRAVIFVFFCYINWNSHYFVWFVQKK